MSTGLLSSAISGMLSAQIALQTAEHNVSNQNTAGFSRQRVIQASNQAMLTGSGFIGQGAHVSTVERMYDSFITSQVNRAQTTSSELSSYYTQIAQIDNMLADPNSGLSPALQSFFSGVQQVAANPAQLSSRQAMVSSAQALVSRYQGLESRVSQMYDNINGQIASQVATINSYATQIGELNQSIIIAQSSISQPANDLLDQRDQLVAELNKLIRIDTTTNTDGSYNVFFGTGQQLVVGTQVMSLSAKPSAADQSRLVVNLTTGGGSQEMPESLITGGSLGGLVKFRSEMLDRVANDLGRNAASLALTFNAQHTLGQDLLGQTTGNGLVDDFFTVSSPKVVASTGNPAGSPTITAAFSAPTFNGNYYTNLTNSDYQLTSDGTNLKLTRLSDNYSWSVASTDPADLTAVMAADTTLGGGPQGFTLSASAAFAAGSSYSYLIEPTREAARNISVNATIAADVRQIAVAAPVRTQTGTANKGNAVISAGSVSSGYDSVTGFPVTLTYDSTTNGLSGFPTFPVTVVDSQGNAVPGSPFAAAPVTFTNGATITFSGISFTISGSPSNNDKFQIVKNAAGVSDGRNALLLGQLQTQNTMSGKTASFQAAYAQLVSDSGNKTREISVTGDAQKALLEQAQSARESMSGVNLDEEAANLIRYQQAYQAAAKSLQIGTGLFDTLLGIMS